MVINIFNKKTKRMADATYFDEIRTFSVGTANFLSEIANEDEERIKQLH